MLKYFWRRLYLSIFTTLITCVVLFWLQSLFGRNPILEHAEEFRNQFPPNTPISHIIETVTKREGFDQPIFVRFFKWLGGIFRGDPGKIYSSPSLSIPTTIFKPLRFTLLVTFPSIVISYILGAFFGLIAAYRVGKFFDRFITFFSNIFLGIPNFIIGVVLLLFLLATGLPAQFRKLGDTTDSVWETFLSLIGPFIVLIISQFASLVVAFRNQCITVLGSSHVLIARAKGLSKTKIFFRYVLRNSIVPLIGGVISSFLGLLSGSFVIERLFAIPGSSGILVNWTTTGEINVIMFNILVMAGFSNILFIFSDIFNALLDPRIKLGVASRGVGRFRSFFFRHFGIKKRFGSLAEAQLEEPTHPQLSLLGAPHSLEPSSDQEEISSQTFKISRASSAKRFSLSPTDFSNLSSQDFESVSPEVAQAKEIQLVGAPRYTTKEIFRRVWHNRSGMIAFFVIVALLTIGFCVFLFSKNDPIKYLGHEADIHVDFVSNLPSSFSPIMTRVYDVVNNSNMIKAFETAKERDPSFDYTLEIVPDTTSIRYTYDSYRLLEILTNKSYSTLLGTNSAGQDVWVRTWFGTLEGILLGLVATFVEALIGIVLGAYVGFHVGKWLDNILMRVMDVIGSIPDLIWFVMFAALFGTRPFAIFFLIILLGWQGPLFTTRRYIIQFKDSEFVRAAASIGASKVRVILFHALPNVLGKILYSMVIRVPSVIYYVSSLAFFGLLQADNTYNLGVIIQNARSDFRFNHWTLTLPVVIMVTLVLSLKFVAIAFHDALEPHSISRK